MKKACFALLTALTLLPAAGVAADAALTRYNKKCNPENEPMVGKACDCVRGVIESAIPLEEFMKIDALSDEKQMTPEQRRQVEHLKTKREALRACAREDDYPSR